MSVTHIVAWRQGPASKQGENIWEGIVQAPACRAAPRASARGRGVGGRACGFGLQAPSRGRRRGYSQRRACRRACAAGPGPSGPGACGTRARAACCAWVVASTGAAHGRRAGARGCSHHLAGLHNLLHLGDGFAGVQALVGGRWRRAVMLVAETRPVQGVPGRSEQRRGAARTGQACAGQACAGQAAVAVGWQRAGGRTLGHTVAQFMMVWHCAWGAAGWSGAAARSARALGMVGSCRWRPAAAATRGAAGAAGSAGRGTGTGRDTQGDTRHSRGTACTGR